MSSAFRVHYGTGLQVPLPYPTGEMSANSVLIVDDESGIRELLTRWLSAEGYELREAPDAETAVVELLKRPADVVMCDVEMPGLGGL